MEHWGGGSNVSFQRGHEDEVLDIAFDSVGQRLVSVSADGECLQCTTLLHTCTLDMIADVVQGVGGLDTLIIDSKLWIHRDRTVV